MTVPRHAGETQEEQDYFDRVGAEIPEAKKQEMDETEPERLEVCEVCKWWDLEKYGIEIGHDDRHTDENNKPVEWQGFCCRFPPQFIGSGIGDGDSVPGWQYPVTASHCYCGEFVSKTS